MLGLWFHDGHKQDAKLFGNSCVVLLQAVGFFFFFFYPIRQMRMRVFMDTVGQKSI